jgi:hypothetical protein
MGLTPLPDGFATTREALHRVAEQIVAPARKPHNEIALTQTPGGFGTPPFEHEGRTLQVRVEGAELVVSEDGQERREALRSLAEAAAFVGADLFPDGPPDDSSPLAIGPASAAVLGELYEFGQRVLAELRARFSPGDEVSEINLWPEHFDLAFDGGAERLGRRAGYGVSPGDDEHPEPYLYVGPWEAQTQGGLWNATGFGGAELTYAELVAAADPQATAERFLRSRRDALAG